MGDPGWHPELKQVGRPMAESSNTNQPAQVRTIDDPLSDTESSDSDIDETIQFNSIGETAQIMQRVSQLQYYS